MDFKLTVVVEKDEDGYFVYCPQLQGCHTQGDSYEEAIKNIEDAIKLYLEDVKAEELEQINSIQQVSLTSVSVSI